MPPDLTDIHGPAIGFMDIGTNSIRVLVVRIGPGGTYTVLTQQKETVRLGDGGFERHTIQEPALQRAVRVAESLDRSHAGVVRQVHVRPGKQGQVRLRIHADGECHLELWSLAVHRKAFMSVFGRKMSVELVDDAARGSSACPVRNSALA